jgi:hypothetical protein
MVSSPRAWDYFPFAKLITPFVMKNISVLAILRQLKRLTKSNIPYESLFVCQSTDFKAG